jgi:diaminopimelate epimerase
MAFLYSSMQLSFNKYQGTGNDFIIIDNRKDIFPKDVSLIQRLCDRRFGIGSDGLILIEDHPSQDYRMVFYNPDGSESLCGNGSRCGFAFARKLGMVTDKATFETTDGIHQAHISEDLVSFSLFDNSNLTINGADYYVNTGSPHYVKLVEDIKKTDVDGEGAAIRYSNAFVGQNGTNVNFAQVLQDRVLVRTYERGVENETLSCGTGVTAVGLVASQLGFDSPVTIETKGGLLTVSFEKKGNDFTNIWLTGPATFVFEGTVEM